jgi:hypothetical protein
LIICNFNKLKIVQNIGLKVIITILILVVLVGLSIVSLSNKIAYAATEVSGSIVSDTTWTVANSPYVITGHIVVESGANLTIDPGVTVKFDWGKIMLVEGGLIAKGTVSNEILFTSNESSPSPGDWGYIKFEQGSIGTIYDSNDEYLSGSILEYCRVEYSGFYDEVAIAGAPFVNACTIVNNSYGGVDAYRYTGIPGQYDSVRITNSVISQNTGGGMGIARAKNAIISGNTISGNKLGVRILGGTTTVINNIITNNSGDNWAAGIFGNIDSGSMVLISHNYIADNAGAGVHLIKQNGGSSATATVSNNEILRNQGAGVRVGGGGLGSSQPDFTFNILDNMIIANNANRGGGIYIDDRSPTINVINNILQDNMANEGTALWITDEGTGNNTDTFKYNTIVGTSGESLIFKYQGDPSIKYNDFLRGSEIYSMYDDRSRTETLGTLAIGDNWWGTADDSTIQDLIYDWNDNALKERVDYTPFASAPFSPQDLIRTTISSNNSPTFTWSPVDFASSYEVKVDVSGTWQDIGNITNYTFTSTISDGEHDFLVRAKDSNGDSHAASRLEFAIDTLGTEVSGIISTNTTWALSNSPYYITGNIIVDSEVTLTVQPGVLVLFYSGKAMQVDGGLVAQGTSGNGITFTSNQATPSAGDWGTINFVDSSVDAVYDGEGNYLSGNILQYCTIEYGGSNSLPMVKVVSSSPYLDHSTIQYGSSVGLYVEGGKVNIVDTTVRYNNVGIHVKGSGTVTVSGSSSISDNVGNGGTCDFGGKLVIGTGSTVSDNSSHGLYAWFGGTITVSGSTVSGNGGHGINTGTGDPVTVSGSMITGNGSRGINTGSTANIHHNTITGNSSGGIYTYYGSHADINYNNIHDNTTYDLNNGSAQGSDDINGTNNWWGTTDDATIQSQIHDWFDNASLGIVDYTPYLTAEVDITSPVPPDNLSRTTSATDNSPTFTWDAAVGADSYEIKVDNGSYSDVGDVTTYTWDTSLSDGSHTFYVRTKNGIGNTGQANSLTFLVDAINPTVTMNNIVFYVTSMTTIGGTSSDTVGLEKVQVQVKKGLNSTYWNGSSWQNGEIWVDAIGTTSWSYTMPVLEDENYTVKVKAIDNAGNTSSEVSNSFTYDTTNPSVPSNLARTTSNADTTPTFTWNASIDATSDIASYEVKLGDGTMSDIGYVTSYTFSSTLVDGNYTFYIRAKDNAGNYSTEASIEFNIQEGTEVSGIISSNTTWTVVNSPYIITGNIIINPSAILTIEPGVTVKFDSGKAIQVDGGLVAQGTEQNGIVFTSNQAVPEAGDWGNISFTDNSIDAVYDEEGNYLSGNILQYCTIEYGGSTTPVIKLEYSSLLIDENIIQENAGTGIYVHGGFPIITNNLIQNNSGDNGGGINLFEAYPGNVVISGNEILNNTSTYMWGGGIYAKDSDILINNNDIVGNASSHSGGGLYVQSKNAIYPNHIVISDNLILNNSAPALGGGIFIEVIQSSQAIIASNTISNNTTSTYSNSLGGGIYSIGRTIDITGNTINDNSTGNDGGGVWVQDSDVSYNAIFDNSITSGTKKGGGLLIKSTESIINNNNFINNTPFDIHYSVSQGLANLDATNNWWSTTDEPTIQSKIYDWFDDASLGIVDYAPYLTSEGDITSPVPPINLIKTTSDIDNTPTFTWDAVNGAGSYGVKVDSESYIDIGAVNSHTWATILSDGIHTFYVRTKNSIGNTGQPNSVSFSIDTTSPTVTIASIAHHVNTIVSISGTASDVVELGKVQVQIKKGLNSTYWNGSSWQASEVWVDAIGTTSWSYTMPTLEDENYTVKSRAIDSAGNISAEATDSYIYDSTEPTASIDDINEYIYELTQISGTASDSMPGQLDKVQVQILNNTASTFWDGNNWQSTSWDIETVDFQGNAGFASSVAFDSNSYPAIAYLAYDDDDHNPHELMYAHWNGSLWDIEMLATDASGHAPSLAYDSDGNPSISYSVDGGKMNFMSWDGSIWNSQEVDSNATVSGIASLAFDKYGMPAICYSDNSNLMYAHWNGTSWDVEPIIEEESPFGMSLVFNTENNPSVCYSSSAATYNNIKYALYDGSSWSIETVDYTRSNYPDLALDDNDNPYISYYDELNKDVKFARWNGSFWDLEVIDSEGDIGYYGISIAVTSDGDPTISYHDQTNGDLKVASWHDGSWNTNMIDSAGIVGWGNSLAIDNNGNYAISYYASDVGNLKLARTGGEVDWIDAIGTSSWSQVTDPSPYANQNNYTINIRSIDMAGNVSTTKSDSFICDTQNPTQPENIVKTTSNSDNTPSFAWDAATDAISGVASYDIKLDDGIWNDTGNTITYTYETALTDGSHSVYVRTKDNVGLISDAVSFSFDINTSVVAINDIDQYVNTLTNFTGTANASGVLAGVEIQLQKGLTNTYWNGSSWHASEVWVDATGTATWSYSVPVLEDGNYTVKARTLDNAGNMSEEDSDTFIFDATVPSIPTVVTRTSPEHDANPSFVWHISTDNLSGIAEYEVKMNTSSYADNGISPAYTTDTDLIDGDHTFYVRAKDNAGNVSQSASISFLIDTNLQVPPAKPTNADPLNGSTGQSLTVELRSSGFSDANNEDTHINSQWQIRTLSGDYINPLMDTGDDTVNLITFTISDGVLSNYTEYYWRVRLQDSCNDWSEWSDETMFKTEVIVQKTITSQGGVVATPDQDIILEFPTGSLSSDTEIVLTVNQQVSPPEHPSGFRMCNTSFDVEVSGNLNEAVTIVIRYTAADLAASGGVPGRMVLTRWDEQLQQWETLPTSVDTVAQTLTATTDKFSSWMVMFREVTSWERNRLWILLLSIMAAASLVFASLYISSRRLRLRMESDIDNWQESGYDISGWLHRMKRK